MEFEPLSHRKVGFEMFHAVETRHLETTCKGFKVGNRNLVDIETCSRLSGNQACGSLSGKQKMAVPDPSYPSKSEPMRKRESKGVASVILGAGCRAIFLPIGHTCMTDVVDLRDRSPSESSKCRELCKWS